MLNLFKPHIAENDSGTFLVRKLTPLFGWLYLTEIEKWNVIQGCKVTSYYWGNCGSYFVSLEQARAIWKAYEAQEANEKKYPILHSVKESR